MSTSPIASSAKVQTALTNLGIPEGFIAYDTVPLLRQLVVALGNVTTGGGSSGDVAGPASSVDGQIAMFDGITGKLLKTSGVKALGNRLELPGSVSGTTTLSAPPIAGSAVITFPSVTGTLAITGNTVSQFAVGGTLSSLTGFSLRDTSAAYDLTIAATSTTALTAARSVTIDCNNTNHTLKFTAASTVTFPSGTNTLAVLGGNAFTEANTTTLTALGTTPTAGDSLINTTAAANGAQQVSPSMVWTGQGWKTNATAASQKVDWRAYVLPVQGTTAPTSNWNLDTQTNGGGYTAALSVSSIGRVTATEGIASASNALPIYGGATNAEVVLAATSSTAGVANVKSTGGGPIICMASNTWFGWGSGSSNANPDTVLFRDSAAVMRMGLNDGSTPTAQTFKAHNVTTGTGASMTIAGGTGSVAGGAVILATSATTGAPVARLTVKASGVINVSGIPTSPSGLSSGDVYSNSGVLTVV